MTGWDDEYDRQYSGKNLKKQLVLWGIIIMGLVCLVVLLAGCSDDRPERLENSVRGYTSEILSGETNKAFDRVSVRCQNQMGRMLYATAWGQVKKSWTGSPGIRSYSARIEGDGAEVTYRFENPVWDQVNEAWKWENGKWVNDEC